MAHLIQKPTIRLNSDFFGAVFLEAFVFFAGSAFFFLAVDCFSFATDVLFKIREKMGVQWAYNRAYSL